MIPDRDGYKLSRRAVTGCRRSDYDPLQTFQRRWKHLLGKLRALIASVNEFAGSGMLIPTGNGELLRWCLENGLRVVQQMTLTAGV